MGEVEEVLNNQRRWHVEAADALSWLATLPAGVAQCCVTSPPYWMLRSYLKKGDPLKPLELGQEPTPTAYVERLVAVFREVRRVLRDDGVLFVNVGDSYAANGAGGDKVKGLREKQFGIGNAYGLQVEAEKGKNEPQRNRKVPSGLKPLDQCNIPHRLYMALIEDGWYGRAELIWAKTSAMPSSVRGWRWEQHRVKVKVAEQTFHGNGSAQVKGGKRLPDASGGVVNAPRAEWSDCPGCKKCEKTQGLILRKGSWRPTSSHEYIFMLTKPPWVGPEPGRCAGISDEDARWLALLVDAEGNICIRKDRQNGCSRKQPSHSAQIAIGNTSRGGGGAAQRIIGFGAILERKSNPNGNATMWYYQLTSKEALDVLRRLYPFFIVKQRQARCAIFLESMKRASRDKDPESYRKVGRSYMLTDKELTTRDRLWEAVKSLNHFGDPDISWVPEPVFGKWGPTSYFCDGDAVRTPLSPVTINRDKYSRILDDPEEQCAVAHDHETIGNPAGANMRDVLRLDATALDIFRWLADMDPELGEALYKQWNEQQGFHTVMRVGPEPLKARHYAAYPCRLVEPLLRAATSERGQCPECGAPWVRCIEREKNPYQFSGKRRAEETAKSGRQDGFTDGPDGHLDTVRTLGFRPSCECGPVPPNERSGGLTAQHGLDRTGMSHFEYDQWLKDNPRTTTGWKPSCEHGAWEPVPQLVIDPFAGSGRTGMAARRLGLRFLGADLNPEFAALANAQIAADAQDVRLATEKTGEPSLFDALEE